MTIHRHHIFMKQHIRKSILPLLLTLLASFGVGAEKISGTWAGKLKVTPQVSLRLVFHISGDSVTMDSPDQNAYGIEGELKYLSADSINIAVDRLRMDYAGRLVADSIVGHFRQTGLRLPLTLTPGVKKLNRPQTPRPPFPYSSEEVSIQAPDALLAATLTLPENPSGKTPVVVLVSGSGLQNRDEELFEHRPFAVIADWLARRGIATLRYDDRGFGESKGDASKATTADFAADAKAVVEWLKSKARFSKIGMLGHSEGGMIAYMLGAEPDLLDFIVSVAGPSVSGAEINAFQNKIALLNTGIDSRTAEEFANALLKANTYRLNNGPIATADETILREIYPSFDQSPVTAKLSETISATLRMESINPWMEYFLQSAPSSDMQRLSIPSLIIYGEKDIQVPPSLNLEPAKKNAPHATLKCYPGLNHLMQHASTGNIEEYREIEETFSEEVLDDIVSFINSLNSSLMQ